MPVATKTGYNFDGWFTHSSVGTGIVNSSTQVTTTENHTLYARFTVKTYTVTFDAAANGGTIEVNGENVNSTTKRVTYDSTYGTLPTPMKTNYTVDGWYTTQTTGGSKVIATTTVTIDSDHTLYARYIEPRVKVTLYTSMSTVTPTEIYVTKGQKYGKWQKADGTVGSNYNLPVPTSPTSDGYYFAGWYNGSTLVNSNTIVSSTATNHTLTANWVKPDVIISGNPQNATATVISGIKLTATRISGSMYQGTSTEVTPYNGPGTFPYLNYSFSGHGCGGSITTVITRTSGGTYFTVLHNGVYMVVNQYSTP